MPRTQYLGLAKSILSQCVSSGAVSSEYDTNLEAIDAAIAGGTGGLQFADDEVPAGVIDGVNASFALLNAPSPPSSLKLFKSGMRMSVGSDFTLDGNSFTYLPGQIPKVGEGHVADYRY